jgi:hypothetical protein
VFIWCLTQSPESYKQWDKLHPENIGASVAVLSKIAADWKTLSPKLNSEALKATLKSLKAKVSFVADSNFFLLFRCFVRSICTLGATWCYW